MILERPPESSGETILPFAVVLPFMVNALVEESPNTWKFGLELDAPPPITAQKAVAQPEVVVLVAYDVLVDVTVLKSAVKVVFSASPTGGSGATGGCASVSFSVSASVSFSVSASVSFSVSDPISPPTASAKVNVKIEASAPIP